MIFPYRPASGRSSGRRHLAVFLFRSRFLSSTLLIVISALAALWLHSYRRFDGVRFSRQCAWSAGFRGGYIWLECDRRERGSFTASGEYASIPEAYSDNWTCSWGYEPRASSAFSQRGSFRHNVAMFSEPSSLWLRSTNADFIKIPIWPVAATIAAACVTTAWSGRSRIGG
jgi:hypothetical protein